MLKIVDYKNDQVHGRVGLTELELRVLATPAFARLSRIRQLAMHSYVFPGATHTRYSHCLGSLEVLGRFIKWLWREGESSGPSLDDTEEQNLRLVALLHDVGQFPFSHLGERVYQRLDRYRPRPGSGVELADSSPAGEEHPMQLAPAELAEEPASQISDKTVGAYLLRHDTGLLESLGPDRCERLRNILEGQEKVFSLKTQLLDSEYDCDRLDYLMRDSLNCRVPYGQIDLDFLIEQCAIKPDIAEKEDWFLSVERRHGLHALEHVLTGRYLMYAQVYFHRQARGFELSVATILIHLARTGRLGEFHSMESILNAVEEGRLSDFYRFDDYYMWDRIQEYAAEPHDESTFGEDVKYIADRLVNKSEPLRIIREFESVRPEDQRYPFVRGQLVRRESLETMCREAGVDPALVVVEELQNPIVPASRDLMVRVVPPQSYARAYRLAPRVHDAQSTDPEQTKLFIADEATLIHSLAMLMPRVLRVYTLPGDRGEDIYQKLRPRLDRL